MEVGSRGTGQTALDCTLDAIKLGGDAKKNTSDGSGSAWNEPLYFRQKFAATMELQGSTPVLLGFPEGCVRERTWQEWYNGIGSVVSKVVD